MEGPPRIDELLARAVDDEMAERRSLREALEGVVAKVAELEATMDAGLGRLGERVEEAPRAAVAGELQAAVGELGRRVDDLGRLVARDLGRLKRLLEQHHTVLVSEVRSGLLAEVRAELQAVLAGGEAAAPPRRPRPLTAEREIDPAPWYPAGDDAASPMPPPPASGAGEPEPPRRGLRRRRA